jgi:hypothetical protein
VTVDDHSAVLIIRVWVEDGMDSFRGRLTTSEPDGDEQTADDRTYAVVSSPSDIVDAVREWLGEFQQGAGSRIDRN